MGCCNEPVTKLTTGLPTDLSQHVNYERGMVLGVDDFRQEFAYQSERDQWLARDAIGYGTLSGLRVYPEYDGANGPRLHVTAGSALAISGKLICVPADQCCVLNKWLAKPDNAATVNRLISATSPPASPPLPLEGDSGTISLYLTLCYTDCTTAPVPIPGEPCRSEDQLMADSRVADDFRLELRADAPPQVEEDALRDFAQWLKNSIQIFDVTSSPPGDEDAWLAALGRAVKPWTEARNASPPLSPPASFATLGDYLFDLSPAGLDIGRDQLDDFLRVAIRFWVTELRPMWMAMRCHKSQHKDVDCLLLARVSFDVRWAGGAPAGAWQIAGSPPSVLIDESKRPILAHLRLLQEFQRGCSTSSNSGETAPMSLTLSPNLAGDANGAITANTVSKVRGVDVVTTGASSGQFLGFDGAAWRPTVAPLTVVPNLAGDANGAITGNTVSKVRGVDVVTTGASSGQFLGFDGGAWVPTAAPAAPRSVTRGAAQAFAIVAAGSVEFPITPRTTAPATGAAARVLTAYNSLAAAGAYDPSQGGFRFTFAGFKFGALYIVKITPWAPKGSGTGNPFIAYFSDFVKASGTGTAALPAGFTVTITVNPAAGVTAGRLMIEVSELG